MLNLISNLHFKVAYFWPLIILMKYFYLFFLIRAISIRPLNFLSFNFVDSILKLCFIDFAMLILEFRKDFTFIILILIIMIKDLLIYPNLILQKMHLHLLLTLHLISSIPLHLLLNLHLNHPIILTLLITLITINYLIRLIITMLAFIILLPPNWFFNSSEICSSNLFLMCIFISLF